jgi:chromosome segregation ATPase
VTKETQDANVEKLTQGLVSLKELTTSALRESGAAVSAASEKTAELETQISSLSSQVSSATEGHAQHSDTIGALQQSLAQIGERDAQTIADLRSELSAHQEKIAIFERAFGGMDAQFEAMAADLRQKIRAECAEDFRAALQAKAEEEKRQQETRGDSYQHVKETCDALWSSVAGLSSRASDLEARVDSM